jgi:hypothetical protein
MAPMRDLTVGVLVTADIASISPVCDVAGCGQARQPDGSWSLANLPRLFRPTNRKSPGN